MKYTINTSPDTLGIVKEALKKIDISGIPTLGEDDKLTREFVATSIILELANNDVMFNGLFRSITDSPGVDFYSFSEPELSEILVSFFENTGDRLISWKMITDGASNNHDDLAFLGNFMKNPEMVELLAKSFDPKMNSKDTENY